MGDAPRLNGAAPAVSCVGVGKVWNPGSARAHEALTDIALDIDPGEFVGELLRTDLSRAIDSLRNNDRRVFSSVC